MKDAEIKAQIVVCLLQNAKKEAMEQLAIARIGLSDAKAALRSVRTEKPSPEALKTISSLLRRVDRSNAHPHGRAPARTVQGVVGGSGLEVDHV